MKTTMRDLIYYKSSHLEIEGVRKDRFSIDVDFLMTGKLMKALSDLNLTVPTLDRCEPFL